MTRGNWPLFAAVVSVVLTAATSGALAFVSGGRHEYNLTADSYQLTSDYHVYPFISGGGHQYDLRCTEDGYQLTSRYPVSRFVGAGAGRQLISGTEMVYLGKSCAYHKLYGSGTWCWHNGGFQAEFSGLEIDFPGQELWCKPEPKFALNCACGSTD